MQRIHISALILVMVLINSCMNKNKADLIFQNGTIFIVNDTFSTAESISIKDGKILATGSNEEITEEFTADRIVDLAGKYVYPGLIDAHCHFLGYGKSLLHADLSGTSSFEEIIDILKKRQSAYPSEWILGRGWDQNDWKVKEFPSKELLDKAFPENPVLLRRIDGHAAIANSEALRRAGIDDSSGNDGSLRINDLSGIDDSVIIDGPKGKDEPYRIEGGALIRKNGKLTGVLVDNAIQLVGKLVPEPEGQDVINALLQGETNCFAVGLTTVHDAGLDHKTIDLIDSLHRSGDLKMRIYAMLTPGEKNYQQYLFRGVHKTDRLNVRSIKLFADGALGSRGALMLEPYDDDPGNNGLAISGAEYLREQCRLALDHGYQVNTHCIGDSANRLVLDLYSEFLKGKNDLRWRIEHAQVIHPDDFIKFGANGIIPSIQSTHATSDIYWVDERLGDERLRGAYAYRQLMEENGWLPNGSDFPVESINPLYGYYALIARRDMEGYPEEGFQIENALSREDAFRAMTIWAAMAAFEENEKGSLEAGKMADFIITGVDLFSIPADEIPKTRILETWLGGDKVYPEGE